MEICYGSIPDRIGKLIAFPLLLMFSFNMLAIETDSIWLQDFETARLKAKAENKAILIYFSGSDWCKPCIKMKNEIFETEVFKNYANRHLVGVLADFPRYKRNKLSEKQRIHNEALAEKYNKEGVFPLAVLVQSDGSFLNKAYYQKGGPMPFIRFLEQYVKKQNHSYKKAFSAMGSPFELTVVTEERTKAEAAFKAAELEISRIEKLISSWDPNSQTSAINKFAGIRAVKVKKELFDLIKRCKKVSTLTRGAFDISFASIDHIWKFDGSMKKLPTKEEIAESVRNIDYRLILLNQADTTVFLQKKGMKIGFGAIGKGYAANKTHQILKGMGIKSGIVNAGGDLFAWGRQAKEETWKIGIADPGRSAHIMAWLELENTAIVTSGNYERYTIIDGESYSHIIDPRTGYPVRGLKSVSIICPDAELADALATAIFVMGETDGIQLIDRLEHVECIMVNEQGNMTTSKNLNLDLK